MDDLLSIRQKVQRLQENNLALLDKCTELQHENAAKQEAIHRLLCSDLCDYCDRPAERLREGVRLCTEHIYEFRKFD